MVLIGTQSSSACTTPWGEIVQPYLKSKQIFKCPSNTSEAVVACSNPTNRVFSNYIANGGNYNGVVATAGGGFGFDRPMDMVQWDTGVIRSTSLAQINEPSRAIEVLEYKGTANRSNLATASSSTNGMFDFSNHLGTTNYLFVDGHVKSMKPTQTLNPNVFNLYRVDLSNGGYHSALRTGLAAQEASMN